MALDENGVKKFINKMLATYAESIVLGLNLLKIYLQILICNF